MVKAARPKLLVSTTTALTPWAIMRGQLAYLASRDFDVLLVSAPDELLESTAAREKIRVESVGYVREIQPLRDLRTLASLLQLYRREKPEVSLVSTPKAGLLAGLAALLTRAPVRIYLLRGLRLETATGLQRWLLWIMEWVAIHVAQEVIAVSPSLLARTHSLHLLGRGRGVVLGRGAGNGIDPHRFTATAERQAAGRLLRADLGIPEKSFVFGFVGRLTQDKGVSELAEAFARLTSRYPQVRLLIVGAEDVTRIPAEAKHWLDESPGVYYTGWLDDTVVAYHAIDALVLPTHREGFPNVCLEAAASSKPVVTTTATGAIDSIVHGTTGLLVPPKNMDRLLLAMETLASDPATATTMGLAGRDFAVSNFSSEQVWLNLTNFLQKRLAEKKSSVN